MRVSRALLLFIATTLLADTLKQKIELGYFGTTGNTNTHSLTAAYRINYKPDRRTALQFWSDVLYATRKGKKSNERYRANLELKHHYKGKIYSFFKTAFLRNTFEGYNQQYSLNPGFGYRLYRSKKQRLDIELGYEFRRNNYTHQPHDNFHYAKGSLEHIYKLTKKNRLKSELNFIENLENSQDFETTLESSLHLHIIKQFSFKLSFEFKYDNLPPANKKRSDTVTKATIVYNF